MNEYVINNFKTSDIKSDIKMKGNQTLLKYSGTANDLKNEYVDFKREIVLDFVLDAKNRGESKRQ